MHNVSRDCASLFTFILVAVLISACGRPPSMHVRAGGDPEHVDEDVAFRTIYYFRVFDYCDIELRRASNSNRWPSAPLSDTLYRFVMTGKASTFFGNIRFESGTLLTSEIEPFGSNVSYDRDLGRFRFESRQEANQLARQKMALRSFRELRALYADLSEKANGRKPGDDSNLQKVRVRLTQALEKVLEEYSRQSGAALPGAIDPQSITETRNGDEVTLSFSVVTLSKPNQAYAVAISGKNGQSAFVSVTKLDSQTLDSRHPPAPLDCPTSGNTTRRGFQILGPEGWRTFDQDERLLLAMSADAQPLIGTLKELSQRLLRSRQTKFTYRVPLADERVRVNNAHRQLDDVREDDNPQDLINRAVGALNTAPN